MELTLAQYYLIQLTQGGFDYLRDNMVVRAENMVQRPLNYDLVDERLDFDR